MRAKVQSLVSFEWIGTIDVRVVCGSYKCAIEAYEDSKVVIDPKICYLVQ